MLGFIAARMVGATRVRFFENGVVSANLPISPQVIGTMATRTTHPLALRYFNELLALIVRLKTDFDRAMEASLMRTKHPYVGIDLLVDSPMRTRD